MKKLLWLIASVLMAGILSVASAEGGVVAQVRFDTPIGMDRENPRLILLEDTLYVFNRTVGCIMTWKAGQEAMEVFSSLPAPPDGCFERPYGEMNDAQRADMERMVTHVVAGDGRLWGLNQFTGRFGQITVEGVAYHDDAFDLSGLNDKGRADQDMLYTGFVSDGTLYLFSATYGKGMFMAQYDLATGARKDVLIGQAGWARAYQPGKALYVVNAQSASGSGGYAERAYELNLTTGALAPIALPPAEDKKYETFIKGITPMEGTDRSFYCTERSGGSGAEYALYLSEHDGAFRKIWQLSMPWDAGILYLCQPISGGRLLVVDDDGATVFDISGA